MNLQQLLEEVAAGRRGFQAEGNSVSELEAFQPLACLIIEANDAGYLTGVTTSRESYTGHRHYSAVTVQGLTDAGYDRRSEPYLCVQSEAVKS